MILVYSTITEPRTVVKRAKATIHLLYSYQINAKIVGEYGRTLLSKRMRNNNNTKDEKEDEFNHNNVP